MQKKKKNVQHFTTWPRLCSLSFSPPFLSLRATVHSHPAVCVGGSQLGSGCRGCGGGVEGGVRVANALLVRLPDGRFGGGSVRRKRTWGGGGRTLGDLVHEEQLIRQPPLGDARTQRRVDVLLAQPWALLAEADQRERPLLIMRVRNAHHAGFQHCRASATRGGRSEKEGPASPGS